jgi:hypothetical protein
MTVMINCFISEVRQINAYNLQTVLLENWFNEMVNVLYT